MGSFTNKRQATYAVQEKIPMPLILMMFAIVDKAKSKHTLNSRQNFRLNIKENGRQIITHWQKAPNQFRKDYPAVTYNGGVTNTSVLIVDSGEITTMMLAEEYEKTYIRSSSSVKANMSERNKEDMRNEEIRAYAKKKGVKQWEIADEIGVAEAVFSKKLRYELSDEDKAKVMKAIDKIADSRDSEPNATKSVF